MEFYGGRYEWDAADPNQQPPPPPPPPAPPPPQQQQRQPSASKPKKATAAIPPPASMPLGRKPARGAAAAQQYQQPPHQGGARRGGVRAGAYVPVRQMLDDGTRYEGPKMRFCRPSVGNQLSDSEDDEEEDDDEVEDEVEEADVSEAPTGAPSATVSSVTSLFAAAASLEHGDLPAVPISASVGGGFGAAAATPADVPPANGGGSIGRDALMQVKGAVKEVAALDAMTSVGYTMLKRMGWVDGTGLGPANNGVVLPVAISEGRLIEGVGLGCVAKPGDAKLEAKLLTSNVKLMIDDFISDPSRVELEFQPDLAKADRALIHVLAQKHNLAHRSQGKGADRFIKVSKRGDWPVTLSLRPSLA